MPKTNYVKSWVAKAEEDERLIRDIIKDSNIHAGMIAFHSQQIVEKLLKGLVAFIGKNPPKVHDLVELETILSEKYKDIEEFHNNLEALNDFYIESRYPDDFPEISGNDAEDAFKNALRIKEFVLDEINE